MTGPQVIGWAAVGCVTACLASLGVLALWATYKYIKDNHNIGSN